VTPFDTYKCYLSLKNHFVKDSYDYFRYCGKSRSTIKSFHDRRDRFWFEKVARQKSDREVVDFFVANFVSCSDPERLWIGDIIREGEDVYMEWLRKSQSMFYLFKSEIESFVNKKNFNQLFNYKVGTHPEIIKRYLQKDITIETLTILDMILNFVKDFDKKITDPIWNFVSLRIRKYKPFLNIDIEKYKNALKEIVL
jgi:hypothetical protein